MRMVMPMRMVVIVVMRHRVVMVMPAHAIGHAKLAVLAAITRHQRLRHAAFQILDTGFQQLEYFALKAKVRGGNKTDRRVLQLQVGDLPRDALDQRTVEQVIRQHHHLGHAQQALALHGFFKARPGDAGERQVDQLVVGFFHHPAGHFGHVAVGLAVGRAAPQNHHAGGGWVGHVQRLHGPLQAALQNAQNWITRRQVRPVHELHTGKLQACTINGLRNVHLDMPCRIQNQRYHQHPPRAHRRPAQAFAHGDVRKLDETDLDAPGRLAHTPLLGKGLNFVVA